MKYIVLLRGVNVGGKNKIPMADLRVFLEDLGFKNVITYIASGNVILNSNKSCSDIQNKIELSLTKKFNLTSTGIKVLVLTYNQLNNIVKSKPAKFGENSKKYYSDVIFLINYSVSKAMTVFSPKEGVDKIWPGIGVIYSQRLGAQRTKSNLNKIMGSVAYKHMTIRTWNTVNKLLNIANKDT